jgi:cytochrome oxidase Cu insertion factor (SCO1/SenC/PrrC family)
MHDAAADLKPPPAQRRGTRLVVLAVIAAGLVAAATASFVMIALRPHQSQQAPPRVSGIPASVPTSLVNLMALTPVPEQAAPGFTLTDQAGRTISLASFKGRAVVLEFMDPHCTDICPIVSREFLDAYHGLGSAASRVVFVAVNVNAYHHGVADVPAFSREQQLNTIPSWHFLTGPVASLRAVWNATTSTSRRRARTPISCTPHWSTSSTPAATGGSPPARWSTTPPTARPTCPSLSRPPGVAASR